MRGRSKSVDAYIAAAPKDLQPQLREVRAIIREVAPDAKESISYRIPFYDYSGPLAWFGLQKKHIGLYLRPPVIAEHMSDLKGYVTTKSCVHLPLDGRIPAQLIRKLVRARMAINEKEE